MFVYRTNMYLVPGTRCTSCLTWYCILTTSIAVLAGDTEWAGLSFFYYCYKYSFYAEET